MVLAFAVPVPALAEPAPAGAEDPAVQEAKQLYRKGKTAFDVGRWEDAVRYFEESYAKSGNELLLFNIGLSYYRWWEETGEIKHLRKARSVLKTFVARAQRNPERLGDPAEAAAQLNEIEAKLEEAEAREREQAAAPPPEEPPPPRVEPESEPGPQPVVDAGTKPDPGAKLVKAGIATMALGGIGAVAGLVGAAYHGAMSLKFDEELAKTDTALENSTYKQNQIDQMFKMGGCDDPDVKNYEEALRYCQLVARREALAINGPRANFYAYLWGGIGGGLGAVLLITGGVLYAVGKKKGAASGRGRALRSMPRFRVGLAGLWVSGRF